MDVVENAISLCYDCHDLVERNRITVSWIDVQLREVRVVRKNRTRR